MEKINKQEVFNYYNKKNRWLGIIDYKTLVFSIMYVYLIVKFVFCFNISYTLKLYIIVNLILPLIIFILLNINEESIIDKLYIIIKFMMFRRIYCSENCFNMKKSIYKKL